MWFLYLLGFIILIIGAFRGGNNTGDIVRKGASGLIKAIIVMAINYKWAIPIIKRLFATLAYRVIESQ